MSVNEVGRSAAEEQSLVSTRLIQLVVALLCCSCVTVALFCDHQHALGFSKGLFRLQDLKI
jgi:hypothetical protein